MTEVIAERKEREIKERRRWDLQVAEMIVQSIGSLLPGLAQNKKAADGVAKAAQRIKLTDLLDDDKDKQQQKEDRVPSTASVMRAFGVRADGLASARS